MSDIPTQTEEELGDEYDDCWFAYMDVKVAFTGLWLVTHSFIEHNEVIDKAKANPDWTVIRNPGEREAQMAERILKIIIETEAIHEEALDKACMKCEHTVPKHWDI